jgi:hypothetical protein
MVTMPITARQAILLPPLLIIVGPLLFDVQNLLAVSLMIGSNAFKAQQYFSLTVTENEPFSNIRDLIPEKKHNNTVGVCVAL